MKSLFQALRIKEVFGKAGFFMVGVLFAEPPLTLHNIFLAAIFFAICIVNGIAIYLLNAGLGFHEDSSNARLGQLRRFTKTNMLVAGTTVGLFGFGCLYVFSAKLIVPAVIVYALWIIYSAPNGLKRIPLLGLATAFVGQLVHFHLGYFVFDDLSPVSMALGAYFSLLFTAGHALHEIIDHDADAEAGLKTSAVFFGRRWLWILSNTLFTAAAGFLLLAHVAGAFSWTILVPYEAAFVLHVFFMRQLREISNDALFVYRRKYMMVYAAATVVVAVLINSNL